ncbi:MAG: ArsR/SmtB family transcription factor [Terriglobales bacterium]
MVKTSARGLDGVFGALADPTRRAILRSVADAERTVGELARPYAMSLAAVSKHLKVLEGAGLIARRKQGSFQYVRLNPAPMREANRWLAWYERFWTDRLDALQALLEGGHRD